MNARCGMLVVVCLITVPAHAQLALTLPRITGVNVYVEPTVAWLSGGVTPARRVGYGFGIESSFDVGRVLGAEYRSARDCRPVKDGVLGPVPQSDAEEKVMFGQTVSGGPCRVCYIKAISANGQEEGLDAWGNSCTVEDPTRVFATGIAIELALGYGQVGSYGRSPLFLVEVPERGAAEVFGVIREAPTTALYFKAIRPRAFLEPYLGLGLSLAILSAQTTPPVPASPSGPSTFSLSAMTLAPGLRLGVTSNARLYAEVGYEFRSFPLVEYASNPNAAVPGFLPQSLLIHSVQLRVGAWWSLVGR